MEENKILAEETELVPNQAIQDGVSDEDKGSANLKDVKYLDVTELSCEQKKQLESIVTDLKDIQNDINNNQNSVDIKSSNIKSLVERLQESQKVTINKQAMDVFEKSQSNYDALVKFYSHEINFYISYYDRLLSADCPKQISVVKSETATSFAEYLDKAIRRLKIFSKKRKKDLAILFSRYNHGFDMQLYKLNMVETYVKSDGDKSGVGVK